LFALFGIRANKPIRPSNKRVALKNSFCHIRIGETRQDKSGCRVFDAAAGCGARVQKNLER
jgi:hypothetical protein